MSRKKQAAKNLKLAAVFVLLVLGLIFLSLFVKTLFIINGSRFDGLHKFNIEFAGKNKVSLVSFSPQAKSISILNIKKNKDQNSNFAKSYGIIIDGKISLKNDLSNNNISATLIKSIFPFESSLKDLTIVDLIRLFLFSRTVSQNFIYERELLDQYSQAQKSTLISLTFTDPQIYQENQNIEIVNATGIYGLGGRLAALINNLGGNVVLVESNDKEINNSKIIYSGEKTYTVKRLGEYLGFSLEKTDKKGIADVIIIVGKDKAEGSKF